MSQNPQVSATVDKETHSEINKMAEKEKRSLSEMVAILLQQAVKNRLRKRKNTTKTT